MGGGRGRWSIVGVRKGGSARWSDDRTVRTRTDANSHHGILLPGTLESLVSLFRDLKQACGIILSAFSCSRAKQKERKDRIRSLQPEYHVPLSFRDQEIVNHDVASLVGKVQSGDIDPEDILLAYSKKALDAHRKTNCLTEVMISKAQTMARECNRAGPLAGMPVSVKDTVGVAGYASSIGYSSSSWLVPFQKDAAIVRLLRDAGAYPFVKTNVPITLLSFESSSDVWGRTNNPYSAKHSPGGSTGGEAALLAFGGSRLGIGTDVAGSVRIPAHYSGIYTIKASSQRFPKGGNNTSVVGQESIPAVYSPMTRTLDDLETVWRAIVGMKPWEYDHSVCQHFLLIFGGYHWYLAVRSYTLASCQSP